MIIAVALAAYLYICGIPLAWAAYRFARIADPGGEHNPMREWPLVALWPLSMTWFLFKMIWR